jgi:hypothetical protein
MLQSVLDLLSSLSAYFQPQPTARFTILSARDWLNQPSPSVKFLGILQKLDEKSITVSPPSRIIMAWECQEANGEDIVYVEVIMPLREDIPSDIRIIEENFIELGEYKLARFLACHQDYKRLVVLYKNHFGLS